MKTDNTDEINQLINKLDAFLYGGVTDNGFDKFYQTFRDKIAEIVTRLSILQEAEDTYYIIATYLLEMANK